MEGKGGNHLLLRPEQHNKQMHPHELEWVLVPESGGNSHKRYFRDTLGN